MKKYPDYLCSYRFDDGRYSIAIPAQSEEEARRRLRAIGTSGQVDGELVATIPANVITHFPLSILLPVIVAVRNFLRRVFK